MPEVQKTVKYLAKELGMSEQALIGVVATTIGLGKIADIVKLFMPGKKFVPLKPNQK